MKGRDFEWDFNYDMFFSFFLKIGKRTDWTDGYKNIANSIINTRRFLF